MTRRAFTLVAIAYACLALGAIISLYLFGRQTDRIDTTQQALRADTATLAHEIAAGQVYLCDLIAALNLASHANLHIYCVTQQQRYQHIIDRLESH